MESRCLPVRLGPPAAHRCGLAVWMSCRVVFLLVAAVAMATAWRWRGRGNCGGINGPMAEGARGERGRGEVVAMGYPVEGTGCGAPPALNSLVPQAVSGFRGRQASGVDCCRLVGRRQSVVVDLHHQPSSVIITSLSVCCCLVCHLWSSIVSRRQLSVVFGWSSVVVSRLYIIVGRPSVCSHRSSVARR